MQTEHRLRVGLIGFGAMAQALVRCLDENRGFEDIAVVSTLVRPADFPVPAVRQLANTPFTTSIDDFWRQKPELIVECAGHHAVRDYCPEALARGLDIIIISVGALADASLEDRLRAAAAESEGQLTLPSGAVGGLDLIASARLAGLDQVRYVSRKPPRAWKGTRAEEIVSLDTLTEPIEFFRGNARDAALQFPQNANVAAAIALAGVGFEKTEVVLNADPLAICNEHAFEIRGAFGAAQMRIQAKPLPTNPKTSWLGALSLARAVLNASARIVI